MGDGVRRGRTSHNTAFSAPAAFADAQALQLLSLPALPNVDLFPLPAPAGIQGTGQRSKAGGAGLILVYIPGQLRHDPKYQALGSWAFRKGKKSSLRDME